MHTTDVIQHLEHTRCLRGCHVRGKGRFLRVAANRGMGTSDTAVFTPCAITLEYGIVSMYSILEPRTRFHWPLFLISSHIMRGCYTDTDTIQVVFQAQCSRQELCIFAVMYTRWALSQHLSQIYPLTAQQTDRWDGPKEYRTAAHSFQARARNQSFVVGFCLVRA